jgi:hypothetical protein
MTMAFEPKLVPTLREGIHVIKMVLYRELKSVLISRHREMGPTHAKHLTGAVVNELFGVTHPESAMGTFAKENQNAVENASRLILEELDHLRIPLTDALRIQFLCDCHEGIDSTAVLEKAQKRDLLIAEREVPLPGAFMNIVRSFGRSYGILDPQPSTAAGTTRKIRTEQPTHE